MLGTRRLIETVIVPYYQKNIQIYLREAGFKHVFQDLDDPATEAYMKDIAGAEIEIKF